MQLNRYYQLTSNIIGMYPYQIDWPHQTLRKAISNQLVDFVSLVCSFPSVRYSFNSFIELTIAEANNSKVQIGWDS